VHLNQNDLKCFHSSKLCVRNSSKYKQLSSTKPSVRPGPVARMVGRCSALDIGLSLKNDGGGGGGNGLSCSSLLLF
jgi:hypothetical protein